MCLWKKLRLTLTLSWNSFGRDVLLTCLNREALLTNERAAMLTEEPHNKNGKLYREAVNANTLFRVWLDLLIPCNLRCRHCYLDFSEKDIVAVRGSL